jgi:hypothetical protein
MWWKRSGARELRQILMDEWDPIGVRGIPEAADEYDRYLGSVARQLREGAPPEEIGGYLTMVEEDWMGLGPSPGTRPRNEALAVRICAWYASVQE